MSRPEIEDIEIHLLLEAIRLRYGYDFGGYARASLRRRVVGLPSLLDLPDLPAVTARLLRDPAFFERVLGGLCVPVSEMFRDPAVFAALRRQILPVLRSWSQVNIWHAGCSTGEEVWSLAILLQEEELIDRCQIYATDVDDASLVRAEAGVYPLDHARDWSRNYLRAGGVGSLADYYVARKDHLHLDPKLRRNVVFAHHNLVSDGVFCEVNLILCRNVLIYFNSELQDRVLGLLRDALVRGGFLCLGTRETLRFTRAADSFEVVDPDLRLYRRIGGAG